MILKQTLLSVVLLVAALLIEVAALARLHLPGAVPDLVLLVVVGTALVHGARTGSLVGFFGGLLTDLAPPADHAAGRYALVLTLIGYAVGLVRREAGQLRSALGAVVVVACASVAGTWLYAGVGTVVGDTGTAHLPMAELTLTALLYNVVLSPFVVPGVMALSRRTVNDPVSATLGGSSDPGGGPRARGGLKLSGRGSGLSMREVRGARTRPIGIRTGRRKVGGIRKP